jgi:hypothetical protein
MVYREELLSPAPQPKAATGVLRPPSWKPICCGRDMAELVRRLIFGHDGQMVFCSVWNCGVCGRLLL